MVILLINEALRVNAIGKYAEKNLAILRHLEITNVLVVFFSRNFVTTYRATLQCTIYAVGRGGVFVLAKQVAFLFTRCEETKKLTRYF